MLIKPVQRHLRQTVNYNQIEASWGAKHTIVIKACHAGAAIFLKKDFFVNDLICHYYNCIYNYFWLTIRDYK